MWRTRFPDVMREYIRSTGVTQDISDLNIHQWLKSYDAQMGLWIEIGKRLNVETSKVNQYYHNTWSKQFYSNVKHFVPELLAVIQTIDQTGKTTSQLVKQVKNVFLSQHKDLEFHNGQLQQTIYRLYYRGARIEEDKQSWTSTKSFIANLMQQLDEFKPLLFDPSKCFKFGKQ